MSIATLAVEDAVGILTIDSPPVNALGADVRAAFADDPAVKAIVLICGGRPFFVGPDIAEFGKPPQLPRLTEVFDLIDRKPHSRRGRTSSMSQSGGLVMAAGEPMA